MGAVLLSGGTALIQTGSVPVVHRSFQPSTILGVLAAACVHVRSTVLCCLGPHVVVGHSVGERPGSAYVQGDPLPLCVAFGEDVDSCHVVPVGGVHPVDVEFPVCPSDLIGHELHAMGDRTQVKGGTHNPGD